MITKPKVKSYQHICLRVKCSHKWESNVENPKLCPKCKSSVWNKTPIHHKCKRCSYEWDSYKELPKQCPYCKSYRWNTYPQNKVSEEK